MNSISLNNLWNYLDGLALTSDNRKWLAYKLTENKRQAVAPEHKKKDPFGGVAIPTDKFIGLYNFTKEDEDRLRLDYLKEKNNLD